MSPLRQGFDFGRAGLSSAGATLQDFARTRSREWRRSAWRKGFLRIAHDLFESDSCATPLSLFDLVEKIYSPVGSCPASVDPEHVLDAATGDCSLTPSTTRRRVPAPSGKLTFRGRVNTEAKMTYGRQISEIREQESHAETIQDAISERGEETSRNREKRRRQEKVEAGTTFPGAALISLWRFLSVQGWAKTPIGH
jgi:hypothetical protein